MHKAHTHYDAAEQPPLHIGAEQKVIPNNKNMAIQKLIQKRKCFK